MLCKSVTLERWTKVWHSMVFRKISKKLDTHYVVYSQNSRNQFIKIWKNNKKTWSFLFFFQAYSLPLLCELLENWTKMNSFCWLWWGIPLPILRIGCACTREFSLIFRSKYYSLPQSDQKYADLFPQNYAFF